MRRREIDEGLAAWALIGALLTVMLSVGTARAEVAGCGTRLPESGATNQTVHAGSHAGMVSLRVYSIVAARTHQGLDWRLKPVAQHLRQAFNYSTYRLLAQEDRHTAFDLPTVFNLPGKRKLNLKAVAADNRTVALECTLCEGERTMMSGVLKMKNRGVVMLGGRHYGDGTLIVLIKLEFSNVPTD